MIPLIEAFAKNIWGYPGTSVYERYEMLNRLTAGALLLVTAGWWGFVKFWPLDKGRRLPQLLLIASILMVVGNASEFYLFSDLSYEGFNMRHVAWATYLLGYVLLGIGTTISGILFLFTRRWPLWHALVLILSLPIIFKTFDHSAFTGAAVQGAALGLALLIGSRNFLFWSRNPLIRSGKPSIEPSLE